MRIQATSPRCLVAADPGQGSGFGHSPRQTSVAEVVTGWLSCEGEEKGKTKHICGVERVGCIRTIYEK